MPANRSLLLRWGAAAILILAILVYSILLPNWLSALSKNFWIALSSGLVLLFVLGSFIVLDRWLVWRSEQRQLRDLLDEANKLAEETIQRQETALKIGQLYTEANDERAVISLTLRLSQEIIGAKGASFVPLDDRAQPLPAVMVGELPTGVSDAWLEYLASPAVRQRCSTCSMPGHAAVECPLLGSPNPGSTGIFCLPFTRGNRQFGMLNLFITGGSEQSEATQTFLRKIIDEATLALEGIRLHRQELATLRELQLVREKADLSSLLSKLLLNLNDTLEAEFSQVTLIARDTHQPGGSVAVGDLPEGGRHLVNGILQTVLASKEPVVFGDVSADQRSDSGLRALMAIPLLLPDGEVPGALLVASKRVRAFNPRQLSMLQSVSSQMAVVVRNIDWMAELEFNAVITERTRLAREIHDGLAQTLGYLKIKMAQLKNYAEHGDAIRLADTTDQVIDVLNEAYGEVRASIDGLRTIPDELGLTGWLRRAVDDFQEHSGLSVQILEPVDLVPLPPEVHAQLIRIVQESLNNIRKHSEATEVRISCKLIDSDLVVEVSDNGEGFDIEDIPGPSQHGLQGMRERAELLGADFQVFSRAGEGTVVRIRLPLTYVGSQL